MGWSFGWASRREVAQYITRPQRWKTEDGREVFRETLKRCYRGNCLWCLERVQVNAHPPELHISLYLFSACEGEWGYKAMGEECGPYYHTCPVQWFDIVPCDPDGYAKEFRERCREYQRLKKSRRARRTA